ncbi:MAG: hypothetical protein KDC87_07880, partial [Planctomycetes bacterium]|nr:hypothetical protein [Planctomycetota bacterium]
LDMTGPATDSMLLFVGPVVAKSDLGLNRKFHLDANTALPVGIYPLPTRLSFTVPNDPSLKDQTFYLQGIRADANLANLHVTSSCQAWVF